MAAFKAGDFDELADKGTAAAEEKFFSLEPFLASTASAFSKEMDNFDTGAAIREVFALMREVREILAHSPLE